MLIWHRHQSAKQKKKSQPLNGETSAHYSQTQVKVAHHTDKRDVLFLSASDDGEERGEAFLHLAFDKLVDPFSGTRKKIRNLVQPIKGTRFFIDSNCFS